MTLLHPGYLLALLGLLPLVAVYWLKVRPTRQPVTAFFLWQALLAQEKRTALFHRLRDLLSLLLMTLTLLAVVLALTEPHVRDDRRKDLLLLVDNSASMNARENGRTRLEIAQGIASDIVRGLNAEQQAAVATVSLDIQYQCHFTTNPKTLHDAIRKIEPSACPSRPEALQVLAAGAHAMNHCRLLLLSDGCGLSADANQNQGMELIKIGSVRNNVGFIHCDLRPLPGGPTRVGLYYRLASSFEQDVATDVVVTQGPEERIIKVIPTIVKPGLNAPEVTMMEGGGPGPWRASLEVADALADDNVAFMVLPVPRPVKVAVESEHGFFLVNSVNAFARTSGELQYVQSGADVVVAGGAVPQADRVILFGLREGSDWSGQVGAQIEDVLAQVKIKDHPVLANCDLDSMPFLGARNATPPEDTLVIAETQTHVPLIYRVRRGGRLALVINMDPIASEFYYSAWFPVLVYNGARYLMGREDTWPSTCAVGDSVLLPEIPDGGNTTKVTIGSEGTSFPITGRSYGPVRRIGFHTLQNAAGQWSLGANLFAPEETLLDNRNAADTSLPLNRGRPLSAILTATALLLLLAECMLYHLRKVG